MPFLNLNSPVNLSKPILSVQLQPGMPHFLNLMKMKTFKLAFAPMPHLIYLFINWLIKARPLLDLKINPREPDDRPHLDQGFKTAPAP